jgi:dTDP-glucose pyrophosphorylase
MKVLILAAGPDEVTTPGRQYPVALNEFDGHPLIELTLRSCAVLEDASILVAVREQESARSHLDEIIRLIDPSISILRVRTDTRGAACTALLAIDTIETDEELLILNANEILDEDFALIIDDFRRQGVSAGVVAFPAIHPRYSYVRIEEPGFVTEAAEKRPISRTATAGFYWFKHGADFVRAAQRMIAKDASVDGVYYICPSLNELILEELAVGVHHIDGTTYHPLKDDRQIYRYEVESIERRN